MTFTSSMSLNDVVHTVTQTQNFESHLYFFSFHPGLDSSFFTPKSTLYFFPLVWYLGRLTSVGCNYPHPFAFWLLVMFGQRDVRTLRSRKRKFSSLFILHSLSAGYKFVMATFLSPRSQLPLGCPSPIPPSLPTIQKEFHLLSHPGPIMLIDSVPGALLLLNLLKFSNLKIVFSLNSLQFPFLNVHLFPGSPWLIHETDHKILWKTNIVTLLN